MLALALPDRAWVGVEGAEGKASPLAASLAPSRPSGPARRPPNMMLPRFENDSVAIKSSSRRLSVGMETPRGAKRTSCWAGEAAGGRDAVACARSRARSARDDVSGLPGGGRCGCLWAGAGGGCEPRIRGCIGGAFVAVGDASPTARPNLALAGADEHTLRRCKKLCRLGEAGDGNGDGVDGCCAALAVLSSCRGGDKADAAGLAKTVSPLGLCQPPGTGPTTVPC